jgi:predicted permease
MQDLTYALRGLRRSPLFAGMTLLTLSLGIGVVTALFAVVDAVILQPMADQQERVVRIWGNDVARGLDRVQVSYPEMKAWRDGGRSFEQMAAIQYADASAVAIKVGDQSVPVQITPVSEGFFEVLSDAPPLYGRWIDSGDQATGADVVAVVSESFWRRLGGGDPGFVGRRLTRAGGAQSVRVIGVASAAIDYPLGTDLWMPLAAFYGPFSSSEKTFDSNAATFRQFHVLARLRPGVSLTQAQAELAVIDRNWLAQFPNMPVTDVEVAPLLEAVLGSSRQVLWFLFAAAGLVFVIAGVNVSALLLMRAAARAREVAVRLALGASRARLTRQTVIEGLVLGMLGGIGGVLVAQASLGVVSWLGPEEIPRIEQASIDLHVLAFSFGASLVWVLTFGTAPSWSRWVRGSAHALTQDFALRGARGTTALRVFTVAEVAAAVVVAVAAGLMVRSLMQLQAIDRGYDSSNMAVFRMLLPGSRYETARQRLTLFEQMVPKVASIPGVASVTPVHLGPGTGETGLSAGLIFEGQTPEDARRNQWATWEPVMPSYFQTLGIPIVSGRAFTTADSPDAARVVIVSEAMARRYWPGEDPIGKRLKFIRDMDWTTVIGVAGDSRYRELTKSWMTVYFPASQFFFFQPGSLIIRTTQAPEPLIPAIRQTILNADPDLAVSSIATMDELAAKELSRPRAALTVASLFALLAIILAGVGVYGVLSYDVSQRRQELAVRSALGASPSDVFRAVVWRSATMGAIGAAIGLAVAAMVTRALGALLYEVSPGDPAAFAAGAAALVAIVLAASLVPARRAAGTDPAKVLRSE